MTSHFIYFTQLNFMACFDICFGHTTCFWTQLIEWGFCEIINDPHGHPNVIAYINQESNKTFVLWLG